MRALVAVVLLISLSGPRAARADTVYEAFGGLDGLKRLTSRTVDIARADPRIAEKFDDIDIPRLKQRLALHFCMITGGGCVLRGPSMRGAHAGLDLRDAHFNALVEDMQRSMGELGVPFATQNRLLAILAPMHDQVVSR